MAGRPLPSLAPRRSQRPQPVHRSPVRDKEGYHSPGPLHLPAGHPKKARGGQVVVEHDHNRGPHAVVVDGTAGRVVTHVGREPRRHGDRPYRSPLPLQEERPRHGSPAQDAERVRVHGPQDPPVPKVPGRTGGRVDLHHIPAGRSGLHGQRRDETVYRRRVRKVPWQLAALFATGPRATPATPLLDPEMDGVIRSSYLDVPTRPAHSVAQPAPHRR